METYNTLPKKLFKVRVPRIATLSDFDLEVLGLPIDYVDGERVSKIESKKNESELIVAMFNLDALINLYINGTTIRLCDDNDIIEIYNILESYIRNTDDTGVYSPNRKLLKEKRITDIDAFVQDMFGHNKSIIAKKSVGIGGFDLGLGLMGRTPNTDIVNKRVGLMSAFDEDASANTSYITNNLPEIDLSKITRRSYRERFN